MEEKDTREIVELVIKPATSLDEAYNILQRESSARNKLCSCEFNGVILYSTDSLDDIYIKVLGRGRKIPLSLNEYQQKAMETCLPSCENDMYMLFGLVEEVGELAGKVSKAIRKNKVRVMENNLSYVKNDDGLELEEQIKGELGDCCLFIAGLCRQFGWSLEEVAQYNIDKLAKRKESGTIVTHTDH